MKVLNDNTASGRNVEQSSDQTQQGPDQPIRPSQAGIRMNAAVDKLQEAMNLLPKESHSSLTEAIKKLVEETTSVASVADEEEIDDEIEVQDSTSKSFTDLWSGMVKLVKEFVPSVPEVKTSPLKRRRTSTWIDKEEIVGNLPLHPDILSGLDSCMREVRDSKDRGESLSVGKFLKTDRSFPKKVWTPPDRPKMYLPGVKINKTLEELIPEISDTTSTMKDVEWATIEAKLRELLIALSQMKWVFEAQAAFVDAVIPENSPDDIWKIPETINTSLDYILTFMLDNITTQLSNVILRRRDMVLSQTSNLRPQVVSDLRSQSVLQTDLLKIDRETCERQAAQVERQVMVQSLKASLDRNQNQTPFRGSFKRGQRAGRAGSKSGPASSYPASSRRGGRGTGGYYQGGATTLARGRGGRGRRGRGRGYNPTTNTKTTDSSANQSKKQ